MDSPDDLIRVLQMSISPVAIVSGVGLLVLSMTNRFARTIDRSRSLASGRSDMDAAQQLRTDLQIRLLYRRSQILLRAITLALASVFFAALLSMALLFRYSTGIPIQYLILFLFVLSLTSLIASLVLYIRDMSLSLDALREELREHLEPSERDK